MAEDTAALVPFRAGRPQGSSRNRRRLPAVVALAAAAATVCTALAALPPVASATPATSANAAVPAPAAGATSASPAAPAADAGKEAGAGAVAEARRRVYPALVNISVVKRFFDQGHAKRAVAAGSGVIVSADGYVLTNYHVAAHATRLVCQLPSGEELEAKVVTDDPLTDLSVLKLRLDRRGAAAGPLPFAKLGDPAGLEAGDPVLAMGNPMLLGSSMTLGIVSNPHRVFLRATADDISQLDLEDGERTGLLTRWIQHDALILPGNSGGPLVDMRGEVVGINELGGEGVGFAIPASVAAAVLAAVREHGEVARGWLGVGILPVEKAGFERGVLIADVWAGSPAKAAGLEPGDLLLAIDGVPIDARFFEEIPLVYQTLAKLKPGATVHLEIERRGARRTLAATVARMGQFLGEEEELATVGATVAAITPAMAMVREYPDAAGVLVTGVRPGFPFESAKPPIVAGDVLLTVGDRPTPDPAALHAALRTVGGGATFQVTLRRKREVLVTVVSAHQEKPDNASTELPKAWLGIRTQVLTPELAQALHLGGMHGLRISEVLPYTRAQSAGLRVGDVLTAINDQHLTSSRPQDARDLRRILDDLPVNQEMTVTLARDGHELQLRVLAEPEPKGAELAARATQADLEFSVREIVATDRMEDDPVPAGQGVMVSEVVQGGLASLAGLEIDDVVLSIDDQPIAGVDSFTAAMTRVAAARPRFVKVFLRRGYRTHFVFIEPEWPATTGAAGAAAGSGRAGRAGGNRR
jgi:serine protease Do